MPASALSASPPPRLSRLASWFGSAPTPDRPIVASDEGGMRRRVERKLFDDIGDFLERHGLAPLPLHFEVAHAYLTNHDPRIASGVARMLADGGTLTADGIAGLVAELRPVESVPQALAALADQLEARLTECLSAADRSHSSARDYGDALDVAQGQLEADPAGTLERIAGLTREVVETTRLVETELKQTRRETERLRSDLDRARDAAERDHLTGLPNRRGFERRVTELLEETGGAQRRLAVALCDIDDFKRVNDVHGHPAGDRVLKFVGNFLAEELGPAACVGRYGGEEFAVLIEGHSVHEAVMLLDEARERLAARSLVNQETGASIGRVTFSAGVALFTENIGRALGAADAALYRAKRGGKNTVQIASAGG